MLMLAGAGVGVSWYYHFGKLSDISVSIKVEHLYFL